MLKWLLPRTERVSATDKKTRNTVNIKEYKPKGRQVDAIKVCGALAEEEQRKKKKKSRTTQDDAERRGDDNNRICTADWIYDYLF